MISVHLKRRHFHCSLALAAMLSTLSLRADIIELTNGDHYRGTVISMTLSNVDFLSEIQGRVKLPREKVAQITLREVAPRTVVRTNSPAVGAPLILFGTNSSAATANSQADAVVEQMRQQGIQPQLINQVQEQIFGKASPEATQKFNEIMSSLMSGKISVQDLRVQAQNSIAQARVAKQELGGDAGEMLDGYIAILQKFINESTPSSTLPPAPGDSAATK